MTKNQYATYLGALIDEPIDLQGFDLEDQFYGYFQCFMPYGENLEKVFEPLANAKELHQRIKPMYQITEKQVLEVFKENASPGYFVAAPLGSSEQALLWAKKWLENLVVFADFLQDKELSLALSGIKEVKIGQKVEHSEINDLFWDAFCNWKDDNTDFQELISVLSEAYYSIACDYYISAYLQYPSFKSKPTINWLAPYFELWKLGFRFELTTTELILIQH